MLTQEEIEQLVEQEAPRIAREIARAAQRAGNEADFRAPVERLIEDFARRVEVELRADRERPVLRGRADAVYNRFIIEFEPPHSLNRSNTNAKNRHAIQQVVDYAESIAKSERRRIERLAGAAIDGAFIIFVRWLEGKLRVEDALPVATPSVATLLKYIVSLSTELALTPENLLRDFGESTYIARQCVSALYQTLAQSSTPKTAILFQQWSRQFGEVCSYGDQPNNIDVRALLEAFGIRDRNPDPLRVLFALHSYYAVFIKALAVQIALYYTRADETQPSLDHVASLDSAALLAYLTRMERGGVFVDLGISNFLEGDFFGWYLDAWNPPIEASLRKLLAKLAEYSLVTLDVNPEGTRDLLKHLYQNLMPRDLRHQLGEYYTPDWLAERLLNQLGYDGDPKLRILDPACGSGTFCVLEIMRLRRWVRANQPATPPARVLAAILNNVAGFDLNPLAVISARVNYLLALGDLIQSRGGQFAIPIYMADSIMTPTAGKELFDRHARSFPTAVGTFNVPASLGDTPDDVDRLARLLEECVDMKADAAFRSRLLMTFPRLAEAKDDDQAAANDMEIALAERLYRQLRQLDDQGVNGIWARIIKNAFAPLFAGKFDLIAGNPPWVNWESLPQDYRQSTIPLWKHHNLFPHGGIETILGKGKKDLSALMTFVAMDSYLKPHGKLGFIITQSVLKTAGAGDGFRRFKLGSGAPIAVLSVDDLVQIQPFESASNRTAVITLQRNQATRYPVTYTLWRKAVSGKRIPENATLDEALAMVKTHQHIAQPVDKRDASSTWLTGRRGALKAIQSLLGKSDYEAHAGAYSGGANAVYWVEWLSTRPDGLVVIRNLVENAKKEVPSVQTAVEDGLLFPLLRGSKVKKWAAKSDAHILVTQDPQRRQGYHEGWMQLTYPKTYAYLKRFEGLLLARKDRGTAGLIEKGAPFYSMFSISGYTFAPYKVVWGRMASSMDASVVSTLDDKPIVPQETVTLIPCNDESEAHYICAVLNSTPFNFAVQSYSQRGGKSFGTPGILENVRVPRYDAKNAAHAQLSRLSRRAHALAAGADDADKKADQLAPVEAEIDAWAAQVWGLSDEELRDIQKSLKELE